MTEQVRLKALRDVVFGRQGSRRGDHVHRQRGVGRAGAGVQARRAFGFHAGSQTRSRSRSRGADGLAGPGDHRPDLSTGIEIVGYLNVGDPDPTPEELEALAVPFAMMGGVASCRVLDRLWFGYVHLSDDQLQALAGGDSFDGDD